MDEVEWLRRLLLPNAVLQIGEEGAIGPVTVAIRFPNLPSLGLSWVWDFVLGSRSNPQDQNLLVF